MSSLRFPLIAMLLRLRIQMLHLPLSTGVLSPSRSLLYLVTACSMLTSLHTSIL